MFQIEEEKWSFFRPDWKYIFFDSNKWVWISKREPVILVKDGVWLWDWEKIGQTFTLPTAVLNLPAEYLRLDWMDSIVRRPGAVLPTFEHWDAVAPKWCYLAKSENGEAHFFTHKPEIVEPDDDCIGVWSAYKSGANAEFASADTFHHSREFLACGWKESLVERPAEG